MAIVAANNKLTSRSDSNKPFFVMVQEAHRIGTTQHNDLEEFASDVMDQSSRKSKDKGVVHAAQGPTEIPI